MKQKRNIGDLSASDWTEVYYALVDKLQSPVTAGDRKWRAQIRNIVRTIGPDGRQAYEDMEELFFA